MSEVADLRPLAAVLISAVATIAIVASYRYPNVRDAWSVLAAVGKFGIVASMLPGVLAGDVYVWSMGAFVPGIEFALRADPLGMIFATLASFLWIFTAFYGVGYMRGLDEHAQTRFFASFAASLSAAMGIAFAQNLVTIFIFYELLSVVTYPLVAHDETREARLAGRKYLAYTFFGGGVLVLGGTVLVFWLTSLAGAGTATVAFQSGGIPALSEIASTEPWFARLAFGMLALGFGVKAALMPVHSWLPDAMVAPTPVSGLLHAVAVVKSGAFGVARVVLDVFGPETVRELGMHIPLATVAAITIVAASVIALRKDNLKRRLAYSTVSQLSYIVLGLALLHPYALVGGLLHIPAHAFMKLTLFFCAGAIHVETHTDDISNMAGIGKRMPLTMTAFGIAAAGMAGIPFVAGFVSKFYLLVGGYQADHLVFTGALLLSGVLNIAYFWPVVYQAFFESEDAHDAKPLLENPLGGRRAAYADGGSPPRDDGGNDAIDGDGVSLDEEDSGNGGVGDDRPGEYAVDRNPSDHWEAGETSERVEDDPHRVDRGATSDEHGEEVTDHGEEVTDHGEEVHTNHGEEVHTDHGDDPREQHADDHVGGGHHHHGPPPGGWERRSPLNESTWLMLGPIAVIAAGAVVLGIAPGPAVFLDLVGYVVELVTGVSVV